MTLLPGPNFALCVRSGMAEPRRTSWLIATGLAAGAMVQVTLGVLGVSAFVARLGWLREALRYLGSAYLAFVGWRALRSGRSRRTGSSEPRRRTSGAGAFWFGAGAMLCNIKALLTSAGVFAALGPDSTSPLEKVTLILALPTVNWIWYSAVALLASTDRCRRWYFEYGHWLDTAFGAAMLMLAARVALP